MNKKAMTEELRDALIQEYLKLRVAVGLLAFLLPIVLAIGAGSVVDNCHEIAPSVSAYYHTNMGDVFVGVIFIIATFFLIGSDLKEKEGILNLIAGVLAFGIALFPTAVKNPIDSCMTDVNIKPFVSNVHYICAAGFFIILIIIIFSVFIHQSPGNTVKRRRNNVFQWCGYSMIVFIGLIVLHSAVQMSIINVDDIIPEKVVNIWQKLEIDVVYWCETFALWAFGVAWATKGNAIAYIADNNGETRAD